MMKAEARVFLGITAFFVLIGVIYWFTSYEDAGAVMLAASAGMGVVAGGAILLLSRGAHRHGPRTTRTRRWPRGPARSTCSPPHSIWPFAVGLSARRRRERVRVRRLAGAHRHRRAGRLARLLDPARSRSEHLPGEPAHHGDGDELLGLVDVAAFRRAGEHGELVGIRAVARRELLAEPVRDESRDDGQHEQQHAEDVGHRS